jgi:hypothetical protein
MFSSNRTAWGSLAHIISAGEILGQKAAGFF